MGYGQNFTRVVVDEQKKTMVIDGKFADDAHADREVEATWVYAKEIATERTFTAPRVSNGVEPRALAPTHTNGGQDWLIREPWPGQPAVGDWIVVNGRIHFAETDGPGYLVWSQTLRVEPPPSDKRERKPEDRHDD